MVDRSNLDDASSYYGLSHSSTTAATTVKCETCDTIMLEEDAAGHICQPRFNVKFNPTLVDPYWLEHNNRKIDAEAKARGETMPAVVPQCDRSTMVNSGAYKALEERVEQLQAEGKTLIEALHIARAEVKASDNQRDADPEERDDYLGASILELMDANKRIGGHGGRRSGGRFKNQKPVSGDAKRQRRYDEILSDETPTDATGEVWGAA